MTLEERITELAETVAGEFNARPLACVPLGRRSGTSVSALTFDNIFNDSLYSSYIITGQARPATNAANFSATLRNATPADVSATFIAGAQFSAMTTASQGGTNSGALNGSVSSTAGITFFRMHLNMPTDYAAHSFIYDSTVYQSNNLWYAYSVRGVIADGTPRQGIKFAFSSGNIANGWIEVIGIKKQ